jgi:hypothetical protein
MIREAIRSWLEPKRYSLHLACRKCNQRLDTKFITIVEAKDFIKLWNNVHNHPEVGNE